MVIGRFRFLILRGIYITPSLRAIFDSLGCMRTKPQLSRHFLAGYEYKLSHSRISFLLYEKVVVFHNSESLSKSFTQIDFRQTIRWLRRNPFSRNIPSGVHLPSGVPTPVDAKKHHIPALRKA